MEERNKTTNFCNLSTLDDLNIMAEYQSQPSRPPFRQLQPSNLGDITAYRRKKNKKTPIQPPLPSSAIDRSTLLPADVTIRKNPKLLYESKLPTLALYRRLVQIL